MLARASAFVTRSVLYFIVLAEHIIEGTNLRLDIRSG